MPTKHAAGLGIQAGDESGEGRNETLMIPADAKQLADFLPQKPQVCSTCVTPIMSSPRRRIHPFDGFLDKRRLETKQAWRLNRAVPIGRLKTSRT